MIGPHRVDLPTAVVSREMDAWIRQRAAAQRLSLSKTIEQVLLAGRRAIVAAEIPPADPGLLRAHSLAPVGPSPVEDRAGRIRRGR